MGRRSRARERAAASAAAPAGPAAPARDQGRRSWAQRLNPFSFQRPTRSRVGLAAAGFGLLAVVLGVAGWLAEEPGWFNSAVLLAVLALVWGLRAAFMGGDDQAS
jgi:hypothetical protein